MSSVFNRVPECRHDKYEAKTAFVGTENCALCLIERIEALEQQIETLTEMLDEAAIKAEHSPMYDSDIDAVLEASLGEKHENP